MSKKAEEVCHIYWIVMGRGEGVAIARLPPALYPVALLLELPELPYCLNCPNCPIARIYRIALLHDGRK